MSMVASTGLPGAQGVQEARRESRICAGPLHHAASLGQPALRRGALSPRRLRF